jgi:hypothetical protein
LAVDTRKVPEHLKYLVVVILGLSQAFFEFVLEFVSILAGQDIL